MTDRCDRARDLGCCRRVRSEPVDKGAANEICRDGRSRLGALIDLETSCLSDTNAVLQFEKAEREIRFLNFIEMNSSVERWKRGLVRFKGFLVERVRSYL